MFLRRMRFLTILTCVILAAVLVTFGIIIAAAQSERDLQAAGEDAKFTANAYHEDDYATATQAEFDAILSEENKGHTACTHHAQAVYPYLIHTPHELAAVFRYGAASEIARSACFQVVKDSFPDTTNLRAWTTDGKTAIPSLTFLNFTGHFDFSGIRIEANLETSYYKTTGLFRNAKNARIENLDVVLYGTGVVIGENIINCTIRNINVEHHIVSNSGALHAVNRNSKEYYAISSIVTRNGLTGDNETEPEKCVIEDCSVRYLFDYDGGASGGEFYWDVYAWGGVVWENSGIVRNCSVDYGGSKLDATNFGGIAGYCYSSGKIQNCSVIIPSTGTKYFYNDRGGWGFGNVGGIVGTVDIGKTSSIGTGAEITDCTVYIATDTTDTNNVNASKQYGMGGIVGIVNAYNGAGEGTTKISNCKVTGIDISGRFMAVAGIAGRVSSNTTITKCSVALTGKIDGRQDVGGLVGGDTGYNANITKTVDLSDCEVIAREIYSSYNLGYISDGTIAGGIVGLMRYGTTLNITRCNAYVGSLRAGWYAGAIGGYMADGGKTVTATVSDCTSFIGQMSASEVTTTGDVWGSIVSKANLILKNVSYLKHLNRIYGTSSSGGTKMDVSGAKGIAAGTAEYTAATKTLQDKLNAASDEVTGGTLSCVAALNAAKDGVEVTFHFDAADFAGYTIEGLYLSLQGDTLAGYTQLIAGGKVLGYLGEGNPAIGGEITCATLKKITYYGIPADIADVRIRLRLSKDGAVKTLVYDSQGNLV